MADRGLKLYEALPNTLGGKRAQARAIFRAVAREGFLPGKGHVFVDPFAGGCSVGLVAKALGYRVLANDISAHGEAVGRALIENDRAKLGEEDIANALTTDPAGWYLPPLVQLPFPEEPRRLLAAICRAAEGYEQPGKRALLRAWMVKFATSISIYGQPRMSVHQRIRDENWDALSSGMVDRILVPQTMPRKMALRAAAQMGHGIFANGYRNEMHRVDALDFLRGRSADIVYLDPPYPDTEGYGRNYVGIDAILENRELDIDEGRFASADGWKHLGPLLDACREVPLVIISLGAEIKNVSADDLEGLCRDVGRKVTTRELDYGLLRSRATEKSNRKREWLVTATRA